MQELVRVVVLLVVTLLVLFQLIQCRSVLPETVGRHQRSLSNFNYVNLCFFRKSRLCNYIRNMHKVEFDQLNDDDQEVWRRGVSKFYSNW